MWPVGQDVNDAVDVLNIDVNAVFDVRCQRPAPFIAIIWEGVERRFWLAHGSVRRLNRAVLVLR
jgi:hypothetical protein